MPNVIKKTPITISEVKELVYNRWSENLTSLIIDQRKLFEYLSKYDKVSSAKEAREAVKRLMEDYGIKEEDAIMLVNIAPEKKDEIMAYLYRGYPLLGEKEYEGITKLLESIRKKADIS
ncbi:MAG: hypothetical protein ACP5KE_00670 [Candidatus Methanodesulfokora sp.]|jgi:DNA-directed RNA polymerase subunit F|nr:MAG: hypothetical protein C0200_06555 [Candidatus Korarchaeota archaeon]